MTKTILLGTNNRFSAKANKWLFSLTGILFLCNGIFNIYANAIEPFGFILGVLLILGGLYYLIYGITAFSVKFKYAQRINIDDKIIALKNSFFKPATHLKWADIQAIEFGSYEIDFLLEGGRKTFSYQSNADVSIEIKMALTEFAESKGIRINESYSGPHF